jgi:hypothetical protein
MNDQAMSRPLSAKSACGCVVRLLGIIANVAIALGYQQHKRILKGQTHLIEFVKPEQARDG